MRACQNKANAHITSGRAQERACFLSYVDGAKWRTPRICVHDSCALCRVTTFLSYVDGAKWRTPHICIHDNCVLCCVPSAMLICFIMKGQYKHSSNKNKNKN